MRKTTVITLAALLLATADCKEDATEIIKPGPITTSAQTDTTTLIKAPETPVQLENRLGVNIEIPIVPFERVIYIDTDNLGLYLNYGKILPSNAHYALDGINGCNGMVIYSVKDGIGTVAVTHYDPLHNSVLANGRMLNDFGKDPRMKGPETFVTLFYTQPWKVEDVEAINLQIMALTAFSLGAFGEEAKVRYKPYVMTPPGTYFGKHSLEVDLRKGSLKSVWHGEVGLTFERDKAFQPPHYNLSK